MIRRYSLLLLLLSLAVSSASAQTLFVYNVDPTAFPALRANYVLLDAQGNRMQTPNAADFEILEDGLPVTDIAVSCPPPVTPLPYHAVLVNDKSGSMTTRTAGTTRMNLAKLGSREFVMLTSFTNGSSIAVTSFESTASIVIDFQRSAQPLLDAIASIVPGGGTLYNPPFLDPIAGAIGMLRTRSAGTRRVIVFLTDGEPNEATRVSDIISAANDADVEIYPVTIGMPMTAELAFIASSTGGIAFGNVNSTEKIRAVYQQIAAASGGGNPCDISWRSSVRCGQDARNRTVVIRHTPTGASTVVNYFAPQSSVVGLDVTPAFVHFGAIGPPASSDRQIVISTMNDSMRIDRAEVVPEGAFAVVDWGGELPPFRLAPGEARIVTVRFTPVDSQKYVASLVLYGAPCPPHPVTLTGGVGDDEGSAIKLLAPLGGELFSGCDSILIRWGGVAPATAVDLDVSSDDGATWQPIAARVTGLSYRWMPPAPGVSYRVRVTAPQTLQQNNISTTAGGGDGTADSILATQSILFSPTGVVVRGDSMFIAESGMHRIRRVDLVNGEITTIAGDGNPGFNGEVIARYARLNSPTHVLIEGPYLFVADHGNHRVRQINLLDGRIALVAGNGESGRMGDGGNPHLAQLQFPSYLAVAGTMLYISDAGNSRIRRVDLGSRVITTVAGGGTSQADAIRATTALLDAPAGIAADSSYLYIAETNGRRIRRVDLQSGVITTIAGTGMQGTTGDGGLASVATFMRPVGVELDGDMLYVTDTAAHRVRRIDLVSGVITTLAGVGVPGFGGDGGDARLANLNAPGQPMAHAGFLYVPDIFNNRIRAISVGMGPGSDSSRSAFSVNVARLRVTGLRDDAFVFGQMAIGQARDSSVADVLCNVGGLPLTVDSARIEGTHASDFAVVAGARTAALTTGACAALELRFKPRGLGVRTATLILIGRCANADTVLLSGVGIDSCGLTSLDLADVGEIVLGSSARDTTIERAICNTDTRQVAGNARIVNGERAFEIIAGGGAFVLQPGECHTVTVRFTPVATGRITGDIDYGIPTTCGTARTRLLGRALGAPEITVPGIVSWGSALCDVPRDTSITISNTGGAPLQISSAQLVANNEGFSLRPPLPTPGNPIVIMPGETASLDVRFLATSAGVKTATLELTSNAVGSPHRIEITARQEVVSVNSARVVAISSDGRALPLDTTVEIRNDGTVDIELVSATLQGPDASSFNIPAAQLPVVIAPGAATTLRIQLLNAPLNRALRARLALVYGPACDSGRVNIELVAVGTGPELISYGPTFQSLVCANESSRDTTVLIENAGRSALAISRVSIENDTTGAFSIVGGVSSTITIAPGEDTSLVIRFAPGSPGTHSAELRIESNADQPVHIIPFSGRRERVEFNVTPGMLVLGSIQPGDVVDRSLTVTNAGSIASDIDLMTVFGVFRIVGASSLALSEGGVAQIDVRFTAVAGGTYYDTLVVSDRRCGISLRVPLEVRVALPALAEVSLPHDTVRPGQQVALPLRIQITDDAAFAASGASAYSATVLMYGTVVIPDSVVGATVVSNTYDLATRQQLLVFRGVYSPSSDRLATILGRALLGDTLGTPLRIVDFVWDKPVGVTTRDGSVTVVGSCLDIGLRIVAAPQILKVRPLPARDRISLELSLDEWMNVRVVLYDGRGVPVARLDEQFVDAGVRMLELNIVDVPSGTYTLAIETAYGRGTVAIVIAK